ncbi:hypothetical protein [Paraburkholderia sp. DHOC27]|uniref:hypothetical protein n=1 Tax=Paraburkholderia sp. DHOC27 TaxID=2303330 RepID=UPI000E3E3953|nr:hypothetical protein [Paraburkholderia sp. DHOC27]RFU48724.1 hypothetical protein D0B32_02480 [Paraburkholderia sp. DHOC27]
MCAICELKIEFNIGHPQALAVAVATREAMESGVLPETPVDGALSNMKLRLAAIDALKGLQSRLEAAVPVSRLMALPDFYVLLIEIGTWGFFHATENGFDPDITPEPPDVTSEKQEDRDVVLVSSEATLTAILDGQLPLDVAFEDSLMVLDAGDAHTQLLHAVLGAAFPEDSKRENNRAVNF